LQPNTSRLLVWLLSLAGCLVLLAILSAASIVWHPALIKPILKEALTPEGGSVDYGKIEISLSPPRVTIENLQTSHPQEPAIRVEKMRLDLDPDGLWGTEPWIELLEVQGVEMEFKLNLDQPDRPMDFNRLSLILAIGQASIKKASLNLVSDYGRLNLNISSLTIEPQKEDKRKLKLACKVSWSDSRGGNIAWSELTGTGDMDLSPNLNLDLNLTNGVIALDELQGPMTGSARLSMNKKGLQISEFSLGVAQGSGRLTPASLKLEGQSQFDGGNTILKMHELKLGNLFSTSADFNGSLAKELTGNLTAIGNAALDQFSVQDAQLQARLAGNFAAPRLEGMVVQIADGALLWQGRNIPLGAISISGDVGLRDDGNILLQDLKLESEQLGTLSGKISLAGLVPQKAVMQSDGIRAEKVLELAQRLTGYPAKGWQAEGMMKLSGELGQDKPGRWQAKLTTSDLGFSSADGTVLVGQLAGQLTASGSMESKPLINTKLKVRSGQALWGTTFIDIAQAPLALSLQARLESARKLRQVKFKGSLQGYGQFSGNGELALAGGKVIHQGSLLLQDMDLTKLFNTFVRDPLSVSQPDLASWQVTGKARLQVKGKGKGLKARMNGRLLLNRVGLQTGQGASLERMELDLPFSYHLGEREAAEPKRPGRRSWGKVVIQNLNTPEMKLNKLELPVAVTPNRLWTLGEVNVPFADGIITITNLLVNQPISPDFKAVFTAQVSEINLAKLAGPNLPLSGSLGGRLSQVSLTSQRLKATGRLEGSFYGGALTARGIAVDHPFNPGREIQTEVNARQIHLEPLSRALKVGRLTGRLDAELKGLRLAYGQPVAFQLKVESIKVPGVDQEVSLRAVNSISLLGTGAGLSGMGLGFFASFFKEFPYEKIAFSCKLKNDVFRVKGLIHEDGVEYLVKRPLLMGINVINRNPDNRISFSDMLERLKRVQQDNAPRESEAEKKEER
jgi:hypothetical protein